MTGRRIKGKVREEQDRILIKMRSEGYSVSVIALYLGIEKMTLEQRVTKMIESGTLKPRD